MRRGAFWSLFFPGSASLGHPIPRGKALFMERCSFLPCLLLFEGRSGNGETGRRLTVEDKGARVMDDFALLLY
jgi:hypothetical protein